MKNFPILCFLFLGIFVACDKSNTPIESLSITNVTPTTAPYGAIVTISGTNFSTIPSQNSVTFNGKLAIVKSATTTQLAVEVPKGAGTGLIAVKVGNEMTQGPTFYYDLTLKSVITIAGDKSTSGNSDGIGTAAKFRTPYGIAVDNNGNLFVTDDENHNIRKISPQGVVTTIAGGTKSGDNDGLGTTAKFYSPTDIIIDAANNLIVADTDNHRIRKITPAGLVSTIAGSTQGFLDGSSTNARFNTPVGLALDSSNNLYVADVINYVIRKIVPSGMVSTVKKTPSGLNTFILPGGIAIDSKGNFIGTDSFLHRIFKLSPSGEINIIAGSLTNGISSYQDGIGTDARFDLPIGIAIDSNGNYIIADSRNNCIRKVTPAGVVTTLVGGLSGHEDGGLSVAKFYGPVDVAIDANGNIFVTDSINRCIRKLIME